MKKYLIFTFLTLAFITNANANMVDGFGNCRPNAGTCPAGGIYKNSAIYGCSSDKTCDCYLMGDETALEVKTVECRPCEINADCDTSSGYGCVNGNCQLCKTCSADCTNIDWADQTTAGYQRRTLKTCDCGTGKCNEKNEYRCAKGYYGVATNNLTGCAACWLNVGGTTLSAGSTKVTDCYLPVGTKFGPEGATDETVVYDSRGTGTYTQNCFYTE